MIEVITNTQGLSMMARFRSRLKPLMLERSVKLGRQLTQSEVAKETGLPVATIQRWYDYGEGFDRIDAKILYPLLNYFNCKFEDLIEEAE